jgi:hypothetical protein
VLGDTLEASAAMRLEILDVAERLAWAGAVARTRRCSGPASSRARVGAAANTRGASPTSAVARRVVVGASTARRGRDSFASRAGGEASALAGCAWDAPAEDARSGIAR